MNRFFKSSLLLSLVFHPLCSEAQKPKTFCKQEIASGYALAIANQQYAKHGTFANKPFKVNEVREVTHYYFKESGMNKKQIAASLKNDPVEVHQVFLQSTNGWECTYYVTLSTSASRFCDFSSIRFQFCSQ